MSMIVILIILSIAIIIVGAFAALVIGFVPFWGPAVRWSPTWISRG